MAEPDPGANPALHPSDPDNVPIRVVNAVSTLGVIGSLIDITLSTGRYAKGTPDAKPEIIVAARLRFDLEMAKILRDAISSQIELLSKPEGKAH